MLSNLRMLGDHRELLWMWVLRDIQIRYKQSFLGVAWAILQPLALMLMFSLVFALFVRVPTDGIPYPIFSYTALLPWTLFSTSISFGVTSLVSNPNLMRETVIEDIVEGHARTVGFSRQLGLPVAFACVERRWLGKLDGQQVGPRILPLDRFFVQSWEDMLETGL